VTAPECAAQCGRPSPNAVICGACADSLAAALTMAASIAGDLDDAIARQLRHGSGGRRSGDEQPLPVDLRAAEAARELRVELATAVHVTLAGRAWSCNDHSIAGMARWLLMHLGELTQHDRAAGVLFAVRRAVDRAAMVLDGPPPRQYAGPCPGCGCDVLGQPGAPVARCRGCGRTVEVAAQQDAMRAHLDDMLFTAAQLVGMAAALGQPVSEHTVRSWVRRRQLVARGEWPRDHGEPSATYRFGDVLILIARSSHRAGRLWATCKQSPPRRATNGRRLNGWSTSTPPSSARSTPTRPPPPPRRRHPCSTRSKTTGYRGHGRAASG
jgi:hypothetical protein